MPAYIDSRNTINREFAYVPDNTLKLSGGVSFLRKLSVGNGWSQIRVGLLVSVVPNGAANLLQCPFYFGMTSSRFPNNPGSAINTGNFYGVSIIGNYAAGSTQTLTYTNPASGYNYYTPSTGQLFRRWGTNVVTSAFSTAPLFVPSDSGLARRRVPLVLWISRQRGGSVLPANGTINTILYGITAAASAAQDYRPDDLFTAMDQYGAAPTLRGVQLTANLNKADVGLGEEFGELDTLEIYWGNSTSPLEIHAIVGSVYCPLTDNTLSPVDLTYNRDPSGADEPFEQYGAGTATASIFNQGTGYTSDATFWGSGSPLAARGFAGTSAGWPDEPFEQYGTGAVTSGVTVSAGTGWSGAAVIF